MDSATLTPTTHLYGSYDLAFDFFNTKLWHGTLTPCILTFSLKNKNAKGYYHGEKWTCPATEEVTGEIALNPDTMKDRPLRAILSTLVHEMSHHWQHTQGDPPRKGYHDRQWAAMMKTVGLMPSNTGEPGGKETGQKVSHYILDDGPYALAFQDLPEDAALPWITAFVDAAKTTPKKPSKVSYSCGCRKFQAKAGLVEVMCGLCGCEFLIMM